MTDTVFLKQERTKTSYNIVYVVDDTSFVEYNWLKPPSITGDYLTLHNEMCAELMADTSITVNSNDLGWLPKKWSCLYRYEEQYYVYSPSDWYSYLAFELSDSVLIKHTGEGPYPELITQLEQISDRKYSLRTKSLYPDSYNDITIHLIDRELGIAIWEFSTNDEVSYRLMVDADKVKMFPMAVNNCSSGKCFYEFKFDQLDFDKMKITH